MTKTRKWKMAPIDACDKWITIWSPDLVAGILEIRVDYDDVDHAEAERIARAIVRKMNEIA